MESILLNVARILAGFNFTFGDYQVDEGESVVNRAIEFYENGGGHLSEEAHHAIQRYIESRYDQMKADAVEWHRVLPILFTGDEISFSFRGTSVAGTVFISPKRIGLTMTEPFNGLHDEKAIQASVPLIFTEELADGSPANSEGVACVREMLQRLYFSHVGI